MKLIFIVYNISIGEDVQELLRRQNVECYTQWPRLMGVGKSTGPRMDSNVWPGANSALMAVVEDEKAKPLMDAIQALRDGDAKLEGIKAFQLPVEAMTGGI
ncbi:MAG: hypothetical protein MJ202_06970 [Lentisphaeria bacterium]|nr:hypothetical protein [Lentisphaeria bacterium]